MKTTSWDREVRESRKAHFRCHGEWEYRGCAIVFLHFCGDWSLMLAIAALETSAADAQPLGRLAGGKNEVSVEVRNGGLRYALRRGGRAVILPSQLGFDFRGAPRLRDSLRLVTSSRNSVDTTWTQPWGEVARVRDWHNELRVTVAENASPGRQFTVAFRVFNDGVGFRYEFPEQAPLRDFEIMDELTEFAMAATALVGIPSIAANGPFGDAYSSSPLSVIDSVQTPLTMDP